jgi:hypothetical protein
MMIPAGALVPSEATRIGAAITTAMPARMYCRDTGRTLAGRAQQPTAGFVAESSANVYEVQEM